MTQHQESLQGFVCKVRVASSGAPARCTQGQRGRGKGEPLLHSLNERKKERNCVSKLASFFDHLDNYTVARACDSQ